MKRQVGPVVRLGVALAAAIVAIAGLVVLGVGFARLRRVSR